MDTRRPGGQQTRGGLETGCLEASSLEEDWRPGRLETDVGIWSTEVLSASP